MKALLFERSLPRFGAARLASALNPGGGSKVGPLRLADIDAPEPGPGWVALRPLLSGICGSDLATVDGRSSRYFGSIVSFPFVLGHEVVGRTDDGARVVVEPVLACAARGIEPRCASCQAGHTGTCERVAFGHLQPGLQTGFCADTGGGWSTRLVAHESQLHEVPEAMTDEEAVLIEPTACAVHAALRAGATGATVAVLGAGTLGLLTIAALRHYALAATIIAGAKHPTQRRLAAELGADVVAEPGELARAVRRQTRSFALDGRLTGGADVVIDCVGTSASIGEALAMARPRGRVVLVGMPASVTLDLTGLWHREIELVGAYAYGVEAAVAADERLAGRHTFALAADLVADAGLGRLLSATYTLDQWQDAIAHAAHAGGRGAVKIAFDLRKEKHR